MQKNKSLEEKNGGFCIRAIICEERKSGSKYVYTLRCFMSPSARCEVICY